MNTALLILEIQNDYFQNGRTPLEKSLEASLNAQAALNNFRQKNFPVIFVQQFSTHPNAASLLPCTKGADFHHSIAPLKNELIIKKHYANSFKDTQLLTYLIKNKINHLVFCGMPTQLTVDSTVRAALDLGFNCTVLYDACCAATLDFEGFQITAHQAQVSFLAAFTPLDVNLVSTEDYLMITPSSQRILETA